MTAMAIAAGHLRGAALVPEVTVFFDDVLLRGNRTVKVHADSYPGRVTELPPAGHRRRHDRLRHHPRPPPGTGPIRRPAASATP